MTATPTAGEETASTDIAHRYLPPPDLFVSAANPAGAARRIHALARAHNQITDDHWGPAPLRALIDAEAAAFLAGQADRVSVEGPPVLLNPQAYSTMALVVHELVTNSAKYGSLSDSGQVHIGWERDDIGFLLISWR